MRAILVYRVQHKTEQERKTRCSRSVAAIERGAATSRRPTDWCNNCQRRRHVTIGTARTCHSVLSAVPNVQLVIYHKEQRWKRNGVFVNFPIKCRLHRRFTSYAVLHTHTHTHTPLPMYQCTGCAWNTGHHDINCNRNFSMITLTATSP